MKFSSFYELQKRIVAAATIWGNTVCLSWYLAQSQILVISLYIEISRETTRAWGKKAPSEFEPIR